MALTARALMMTSLLALMLATPQGAAAWVCALADSVTVSGPNVRLAEICTASLPASVADIHVLAGGRPNSVRSLARRTILRHLVAAGLASGVKFSGSAQCQVHFAGAQLGSSEFERRLRLIVQPLVPAQAEGAPASWFEFQFTVPKLAVVGEWDLSLQQSSPLEPGRNLLRVNLTDDQHTETIPVTVVLHHFGEVARAATRLERGQEAGQADFTWNWRDLAEAQNGLVSGRVQLAGNSLSRGLNPGDNLRLTDLKPTPVILAGDPVELRVVRGAVAVTVRAHARQDGCMGQTIPVRSQLNGELINARVSGPGMVEWRR